MPKFMKNVFLILSVALVLTSCYKEKKLEPTPPIPLNTGNPPAAHTNFIFSGNMFVEKYDSLGNPVTNYTVYTVASKMIGNNPNYVLSTNFDGSALKGEVKSEINVEVPTTTFYNLNAGTGVFINGVINGVFTSDSLKYRVYLVGANNNNVYLNYRGKLTSSF